jgi:hypothetical protein
MRCRAEEVGVRLPSGQHPRPDLWVLKTPTRRKLLILNISGAGFRLMIWVLLMPLCWRFGLPGKDAQLRLEILALRHQLAVLSRASRRPKIRGWDRLFWIALKAAWAGWRRALVIVRPEIVVGWHRRGFRMFWRWKSRPRIGQPGIDRDVVRLIRRMWRDNTTWESPRIGAEP